MNLERNANLFINDCKEIGQILTKFALYLFFVFFFLVEKYHHFKEL